MCAFLALSLVGTNLYAYPLDYTVTPSRFACAMKNLGRTDEEIRKMVADIMKNGLPLKAKAGNKVLFTFKKGTFMDSFVSADGKTATFADVLSNDGGKAESKTAIETATDICATAYATNSNLSAAASAAQNAVSAGAAGAEKLSANLDTAISSAQKTASDLASAAQSAYNKASDVASSAQKTASDVASFAQKTASGIASSTKSAYNETFNKPTTDTTNKS